MKTKEELKALARELELAQEENLYWTVKVNSLQEQLKEAEAKQFGSTNRLRRAQTIYDQETIASKEMVSFLSRVKPGFILGDIPEEEVNLCTRAGIAGFIHVSWEDDLYDSIITLLPAGKAKIEEYEVSLETNE